MCVWGGGGGCCVGDREDRGRKRERERERKRKREREREGDQEEGEGDGKLLKQIIEGKTSSHIFLNYPNYVFNY